MKYDMIWTMQNIK